MKKMYRSIRQLLISDQQSSQELGVITALGQGWTLYDVLDVVLDDFYSNVKYAKRGSYSIIREKCFCNVNICYEDREKYGGVTIGMPESHTFLLAWGKSEQINLCRHYYRRYRYEVESERRVSVAFKKTLIRYLISYCLMEQGYIDNKKLINHETRDY